MRGVPRIRGIALAAAVGVADLGASSVARGPVVARALRVAGERSAVRTRAGQDLVRLQGDLVGNLGDVGVLGELAPYAMEGGEIRRDQVAARIIPGARADPVARPL